MAAFGKNNYASPFGGMAPYPFFATIGGPSYYNYSGFSARNGAIRVSPTGEQGTVFLPYTPALTFPLNFEIFQGIVTITWKSTIPEDPIDKSVTYEIQFTRTFSRDSGWKTLSIDVPSTITSLKFDVSEIPYTEDGGLRIRAKNSKGLYSKWSYSNEPFTISNHAPNPVILLSPLPNEEFDECMNVIWKEPTISDIDGHDVTYKIEMTSTYSKNSGWITVPGAENLSTGTSSYTVSVNDFPEGEDYGVRITSIDELGLASVAKQVGPISLLHIGNFYIDTSPPIGTITINDGAQLAKSKTVKLTLNAYDETTGVKDVRFKNSDEDFWSDWDTFSNQKFWDLNPTDGVKRVFVQFRDYADNISSSCECEILSRILCEAGNITDIEVFNNKLYAAFDINGNLVEYRVLVNKAATFSEPSLTALARYQNYLYVASYDEISGSSVYAFDGGATPRRVFGIADTKILSMISYNDILYIGTNKGQIFAYSGADVTVSYAGSSAITNLRTDGALLFASVQNGGEYLYFNGASWYSNIL